MSGPVALCVVCCIVLCCVVLCCVVLCVIVRIPLVMSAIHGHEVLIEAAVREWVRGRGGRKESGWRG